MRIDSDYDTDHLGDAQVLALALAVEQIKRDHETIKELKATIAMTKEDLSRVLNSTCKCCHAKFGAEPVFSGEEGIVLPTDDVPVPRGDKNPVQEGGSINIKPPGKRSRVLNVSGSTGCGTERLPKRRIRRVGAKLAYKSSREKR